MAPSHANFLRPAGAGANGVGRLKGSHQRSLGMESPNALRRRFEAGSVCTFTATKTRHRVLRRARPAKVNIHAQSQIEGPPPHAHEPRRETTWRAQISTAS